jgi:hypothetical protein
MKQITVYNIESGDIVRKLSITEDHIDQNINKGEAYIEGFYNDDMYYIKDGELTLKDNKPSEYHFWSDGQWNFDRDLWLEQHLRFKRNVLLKETDYKMLPDVQESMTDESKQKWNEYRKQLRDLPDKYINIKDIVDIEWPEEPK